VGKQHCFPTHPTGYRKTKVSQYMYIHTYTRATQTQTDRQTERQRETMHTEALGHSESTIARALSLSCHSLSLYLSRPPSLPLSLSLSSSLSLSPSFPAFLSFSLSISPRAMLLLQKTTIAEKRGKSEGCSGVPEVRQLHFVGGAFVTKHFARCCTMYLARGR
jgi:hypothetical protein